MGSCFSAPTRVRRRAPARARAQASACDPTPVAPVEVAHVEVTPVKAATFEVTPVDEVSSYQDSDDDYPPLRIYGPTPNQYGRYARRQNARNTPCTGRKYACGSDGDSLHSDSDSD